MKGMKAMKEEERKKEEEKKKLKPQPCPQCEELNGVGNEFCYKCGQILNLVKAEKIIKRKEQFRKDLVRTGLEKQVKRLIDERYNQMAEESSAQKEKEDEKYFEKLEKEGHFIGDWLADKKYTNEKRKKLIRYFDNQIIKLDKQNKKSNAKPKPKKKKK